MVGNLTVDKASLNLSYFLKSVKIISDNNGRILRPDFVDEMADFMGTYATKDGKENRTPYNKIKQVQYFGFSNIDKNDEGSWLCLTRRGEILATLISENFQEKDPEKKYYLKPESITLVRKLFIYDLLYNSYGRNNCGAEQSKSDTEPPKVIVKLLATIGECSCDEICYAIYALNGGKAGNVKKIRNWDDIISTITSKRMRGEDYAQIFEEWGIKNIVQDFKIVNLLSNPNIDVVRENNGLYSLSPEVESQYVEVFKQIPTYYRPLMQLFTNTANEPEEVLEWILDYVINKKENSSELLVCDIRQNENELQNNITNIVRKAIALSQNNIYILIMSNSKEQLLSSFGPYETLLERIDDVKSRNNGDSVNMVTGMPIQKFPANLHIISIIVNK